MQFFRKSQNMKKKFRVEKGGMRADVFLASAAELTRSYIKNLCDEGRLCVNGESAKGNRKLKDGDEIVLEVPENIPYDVRPMDIPIDIVYQDDDIAVINKPQGLTVHAGNGTGSDTLVNALLYRLDNLSGINGVLRPGIVHRIDKNTSGLLVVAKNDKAHLALSAQLADKTCKRTYVALLNGVLKEDSGRIETFIGRNPSDRTKMAVLPSGRRAVTNFKVLKRYKEYTFCEFLLETGRTHQIRVHAKHIGHPIVGDKEYGYKNCKFNLNGQLLHAERLEFIHPSTGKKVNFYAPIPDYFDKILKSIKNTET